MQGRTLTSQHVKGAEDLRLELALVGAELVA